MISYFPYRKPIVPTGPVWLIVSYTGTSRDGVGKADKGKVDES